MGKVRWVDSVGGAWAGFDWLMGDGREGSFELWWVDGEEGWEIACHTREAGVDGCREARRDVPFCTSPRVRLGSVYDQSAISLPLCEAGMCGLGRGGAWRSVDMRWLGGGYAEILCVLVGVLTLCGGSLMFWRERIVGVNSTE